MAQHQPRDFENVLQKINKFITLKDDDKMKTAQNFDAVRDYILKKMRDQDPAFEKLCAGPSLAGSYADNLKVGAPDEYDLVIHMKLPYFAMARIEPDSTKAGYVRINIKSLLEECSKNPNNKIVYTCLMKMVDSEGYLRQQRFQSWIEGILTQIQVHEDVFVSRNLNRHFKLQYRKTGPAHTCYVSAYPVEFSVDFVPGLLFDKASWPAKRRCPSTYNHWLAIPKPFRGVVNNDNILWQTSYVDTERPIINSKNNLKNTLRMLKKLRDRLNLQNFKSYFIKTLYLWECEKQEYNAFFWNQSATILLMHMLKKWVDCLEQRSLPFYWDDKCNMLGNLTDFQINTMYGHLKGAYTKIEMIRQKGTDLGKVFEYFLTPDEIKMMITGEDFVIIDDATAKIGSWSPGKSRGQQSSCSLM